METRSIKFNVKQFLEDYMYSIETEDEDDERELTEELREFMSRSSEEVKQGIKCYITKFSIMTKYPYLLNVINEF